jgi:hypothetical protein
MLISRQRVTRLPRRGAQWLARLLAVVLAGGATSPAMAYQTYTVRSGGRVVTLEWQHFPVRYFVTDRAAGGISANDLQGAIARAFNTWQGVSTSKVSAQFAGFTPADPFDDDGMSTLGFLSRPDLDRVLGATDFLIDTTTGEIVESDIFFNSAFPWSVSASGESGKYDLESIALHEIGHLFGLGHSALGETELRAGGGRRVIAAESVMFPIAFSAGNTSGRTLRADDMAGLSDLYPSDSFKFEAGTINGRVTKNGQGVYGAHIVAFDPKTGKLVGGFTVDSNGSFTIGGLDPDTYVLRVEPVDDADLDSFFDDPELVDLNFAITFFDRYVIVPHGGSSGTIEIKVSAKSGTSSTAGSSTGVNPGTRQPGGLAPGAPVPGVPVRRDPPVAPPDRRLPNRRSGATDASGEAVSSDGGFATWLVADQAGEDRPAGLARRWLAVLGVGRPPTMGASPVALRMPPAGVGRAADARFDRQGDVGEKGVQRQPTPSPAAQKRPPKKPKEPGRSGSFEVSASALWMGKSSLGSSTATLTPNQTGTSDRYTYFKTSEEMQSVAGFEGCLTYNLTRVIAVEGGMTYSRPGVGLTVSSDAEGAAGISVTGETLRQYFFDVAGVVALRSSAARQGRWTPFVEGGIGYLRQLHETSTLVETGQVFHGGGGVKYRLASSPTSFVTGISLRIDARLYYLNKGFSFDSKARTFPLIGAGLVVSF